MTALPLLTQSELHEASVIAQAVTRPTLRGKIARVTGNVVEFEIPGVRIGDMVRVHRGGNDAHAEVVGFRGGMAMALPYGDTTGIKIGSLVTPDGSASSIPTGDCLLGRTIDAFGRPLDGKGRVDELTTAPLLRAAPAPTERAAVSARFDTGIGVIDSLLTFGCGQRVGLFAGAGIGKTTLVQQIGRQASCDVKVIALIGERGIEAHDVLSGFDMSDSVLVVSTSDRAPLERVRGALAATAIAESFRDRGANVLLVVDSLTRYAMALREVGLAAGELPATKGYPPSVFAALPRLLERVAPLSKGGSITGLYTVLVEGDDLSDPVADSARSLLDGHVVLSRQLAMRGHFPAVDVLASASRVMHKVVKPQEVELAQQARTLLAERAEAVELRNLGVGMPGQDARTDALVAAGVRLDRWARQASSDKVDPTRATNALREILDTPREPAGG
jgi:flagellum-specific ATP synthase